MEKGGNHAEQTVLVVKNQVLKGLDPAINDASDYLEFLIFSHSVFPHDTDTGENGSKFFLPMIAIRTKD
jgi:hypothetical protein